MEVRFLNLIDNDTCGVSITKNQEEKWNLWCEPILVILSAFTVYIEFNNFVSSRNTLLHLYFHIYYITNSCLPTRVEYVKNKPISFSKIINSEHLIFQNETDEGCYSCATVL